MTTTQQPTHTDQFNKALKMNDRVMVVATDGGAEARDFGRKGTVVGGSKSHVTVMLDDLMDGNGIELRGIIAANLDKDLWPAQFSHI